MLSSVKNYFELGHYQYSMTSEKTRLARSHKGVLSDTRHCLFFQPYIRHWGQKLVDIKHSKISPTLDTLLSRVNNVCRFLSIRLEAWIVLSQLDTRNPHFKVDTRHCQKFELTLDILIPPFMGPLAGDSPEAPRAKMSHSFRHISGPSGFLNFTDYFGLHPIQWRIQQIA